MDSLNLLVSNEDQQGQKQRPPKRKTKQHNTTTDPTFNKKLFVNSVIAATFLSKKHLIATIIILITQKIIEYTLKMPYQIKLESQLYIALDLEQQGGDGYQELLRNVKWIGIYVVLLKFVNIGLQKLKFKQTTRFRTSFRQYITAICYNQILNQPQEQVLQNTISPTQIYEDGMDFSNIFSQVIDNMLTPILSIVLSVGTFSMSRYSLICYIILPLIFPTVILFEQQMRAHFKVYRREIQETKQKLVEIHQRQMFIKCHQSTDYEMTQFSAQMERQFNIFFQEQKIRHRKDLITMASTQYKDMSVLFVQLYNIRVHDWLITQCMIFNNQVNNFYRLFEQIVRFIGQMNEIDNTVANIRSYFKLRQEEPKDMNLRETIGYFRRMDNHIPVLRASSISLSLQNVTFGYSPDEILITNLSYQFTPNLYVIKGRSGCGKTTLFKLLQRLYTINSGAILLNGKDVRDIDLYSLRHRISIVMQHNVVLKGKTLAENIHYDLKLDERQIQAAAELCQINFMKLDDIVGELSGGQMQRVALARGIARCTDVLLLDEATSALDMETEQRILTGLREFCAKQGVICIMIAHREACYRYCDVIIDMGG